MNITEMDIAMIGLLFVVAVFISIEIFPPAAIPLFAVWERLRTEYER